MMTMFLRAMILFVSAVVSMRLMGKRQVGQFQPFELVVAIMIAELAATPMENVGTPILYGLVPMMALGAKGVITVAGNLIPDMMSEMCLLCLKNNVRGASQLYLRYAELIDLLFCEVNPIPLKYAMKLLGRDSGILRLPLCEISANNGEKLRREMVKIGLLPF